MTDLSIQQKQLIKHIKSTEPWLSGYSDEQVLSILNGENVKGIKLSEQQKISILMLKKSMNSTLGLTVEKQNKPEISANPKEKEDLKAKMRERVFAVSENVDKAEESNSLVGTAWSWAKNNVPLLDKITDSSNEVRAQYQREKKLFDGDIRLSESSLFKELTGAEYNDENKRAFLDGELKTKAEQALSAYEEGQAMAVDTATDMAAGVVAVGAYAVGFGLAPVTGGASIAVGLAAATATGALVKVGTKAISAVETGKEYKASEIVNDMAFGAISGFVAPFTGGTGGAVGKVVAKRVGVNVVKTMSKQSGKALAKKAGKEYLEETAEKSFKQTFKNAMANPTGNQYQGGNAISRGVSELSEIVTDGTMSGMLESAGRTAWEGGDLGEIVDATKAGFVGGLVGSGLIGGGMKVTGALGENIAGKISKNIPNNIYKNVTKDNIKDVLTNIVGDDSYKKFSFRSLFENVDKYDYDNIERHLKNIEFVVKKDYTNGCYRFIENGYFSSKEGADYFEYLMKNVKEPKGTNYGQRSNLDLIMSRYSVEDLKLLEKRGLLDKLCSMKDSWDMEEIVKFSDKQFDNMNNFKMFDKGLMYASENPEVCKLMLKVVDNGIMDGQHYNLKTLEKHLNSCCDNSKEKVNQLVNKLMQIEDKSMLYYACNFKDPAYFVDNYKAIEKVFKKYEAKGLNLNNFNDINCVKVLQLSDKRGLDVHAIAVIGHCVNDNSVGLISKLLQDTEVNPSYIRDLYRVYNLQNIDWDDIDLDGYVDFQQFLSSKPPEFVAVCKKYGLQFDEILAKVNNTLGRSTDIVPVNPIKQKNFMKNIMSNNNSSVDKVLKNFDFHRFEKQGLPLKYSRKDFTDKVYDLLDDLSNKEQKELLAHFGMKFGADGYDGFDGIPLVKSPEIKGASSKVQDAANKLSAEIDKFMTQNKVVTGNPEVDEMMTALVQGLPEFTAMVGKKQHDTHAYSLDIHTLKVLQNAVNDPIYDTMTDKSKTIFKFATLLHDLGKKGGVVDDGHSILSTKYIDGILEKFNFPKDMKKQIVEVVENHHWFEKYNKGETTADKVAPFCVDPEMFKIYKLFAKADLSSVSDDFHLGITGAKTKTDFDKFMDNKFVAIEKSINDNYLHVDFAFDTKFVKGGALFPKSKFKINGKDVEIPVLNFNKLSKNTDMQQFGFASGVKAADVRFFAHMTFEGKGGLDVLTALDNTPLQHEVLSKSLVNPYDMHVYENRQFGQIYEVKQSNIVRTFEGSSHNGTGGVKSLDKFKELFDKENSLYHLEGHSVDLTKTRTFATEHFFNKAGVYLSDGDYVELCKYIMGKKHISQIKGKVKIGNNEIDAKYIRDFLEKNSKMLTKGDNEVVSRDGVPTALVAIVKNESEIPEYLVEYAYKHNLGIIVTDGGSAYAKSVKERGRF